MKVEEKEISDSTDVSLLLLLEISFITSSFRPQKTEEGCIVQKEQVWPLRSALLMKQIGL